MAAGDNYNIMQVRSRLIADDSIGLLDIEVEVQAGVVVLSGEVNSEQQKRRAEELAAGAEGIVEVENHIKVVPPEPDEGEEDDRQAHLGYAMAEGSIGDTAFAIAGEYAGPGAGIAASEQFPGEFSDDEVQKQVDKLLDKQTELDLSNVKACVDNQVVHLNGSIKTEEDLQRLQDALIHLRGAMGVASHLLVEEGDVGTPNA